MVRLGSAQRTQRNFLHAERISAFSYNQRDGERVRMMKGHINGKEGIRL
jgi:hypothetical protein